MVTTRGLAGLLAIALLLGGGAIIAVAPEGVGDVILPTAAAEDCVTVDPQTGQVTVQPGACHP